jgi:hypothetical protein
VCNDVRLTIGPLLVVVYFEPTEVGFMFIVSVFVPTALKKSNIGLCKRSVLVALLCGGLFRLFSLGGVFLSNFEFVVDFTFFESRMGDFLDDSLDRFAAPCETFTLHPSLSGFVDIVHYAGYE